MPDWGAAPSPALAAVRLGGQGWRALPFVPAPSPIGYCRSCHVKGSPRLARVLALRAAGRASQSGPLRALDMPSALIHGANLWESRLQARALHEAAFPRATCAKRAAARWVRAAVCHGRAASRAGFRGMALAAGGCCQASPKERRQVVAWKVAKGQSRSDQGE
ncbi:hypothetical protein AFAE65S_00112 [Alcaligenes phenolicus]